jgi:hypothetical protein
MDLVEVLLVSKKYTAAALPALAQNMKAQTAISHANKINDRIISAAGVEKSSGGDF